MMRIAANIRCFTVLKSWFSTVRCSSEVFVSRLSFYTKHDEFRNMFSQFGKVKEVVLFTARLIMDNKTGRTKGFGFVTFETEDEALKAIKGLNGRVVQGRLVFVESATSTKADGNDAKSNS
ncbi:organelle RRM domain-containing protein 6, chloroplastic-like isoform X1 [Chenopodium quinoa]|uniref:RRM domain-containing protein n=1 Tax=Chenopodium quinoa TaxID=63459 RepID=A0A803N1C5_CHEQI|nr:organelle RRM domain-containing protein 6, chloroplastic-like isoform X1 [Chenopodium quinoa]XP_021729292.1 organelle RRM domain-containing protein 6, chloroplastic-like isoform X1 [Chenopodium quinoa]